MYNTDRRAASTAISPAQAQSEICGRIDEEAIEALLGGYYQQLGDSFPLSEKTCDSMAGDSLEFGCPSAAEAFWENCQLGFDS